LLEAVAVAVITVEAGVARVVCFKDMQGLRWGLLIM
jgi:hypothetical protein